MRQRRDGGNQRCNNEQCQSHQSELVDPLQARSVNGAHSNYFA
jgi:hypothetical protein